MLLEIRVLRHSVRQYLLTDRQTDMAYNPRRLEFSSLVMCMEQKKDNVTFRL
jgi:hypothetical protein